MTAAELRALIAGATPGNWKHDAMDNVGKNWLIGVINTGVDRTGNFQHIVTTDDLPGSQCGGDTAAADAALIVALVNNAERFAELLRREEAAVVASGATTEPVSDPYKLHWAWYGNDHVYLTAELEIVGVVHLPQSGSCIEYPWRCGSVVGTALCIGDARAAVEAAVRAGR